MHFSFPSFSSVRQVMTKNPALYTLAGGLLGGIGGGLLFAGYKFNNAVVERRLYKANKPSGLLEQILVDVD